MKPKLSKISDLPYKIHGKNVKVCNLKLNLEDDNSNENIEKYINKLLENIRTKIKGISSFQIQCKFSSGKTYTINSYQNIKEVFEMRDIDTLYQNVGDVIELNIFFS